MSLLNNYFLILKAIAQTIDKMILHNSISYGDIRHVLYMIMIKDIIAVDIIIKKTCIIAISSLFSLNLPLATIIRNIDELLPSVKILIFFPDFK